MSDSLLTASEKAYSLGVQITKGKDLVRGRTVSEGEEAAWSTAAELLLIQAFGKESPSLKGFKQARPRHSLADYKNPDAMAQHRKQTVLNRIQVLTSLMAILDDDAQRERRMETTSMAKSKQVGSAGQTIGPREGAARIREQIRKGRALLESAISSAEEQAWEAVTKRILAQAFGEGADPVTSVMDVGKYAFAFGGGTEEQYVARRHDDMQTRLTIMGGLAEALESEWRAMSPNSIIPTATDHSKVFLVHGHDQGVVEACARMVDRFGLTPIILHEQPNEGRTVIEKLEHHADAGFAVVILTPDDVGGAKDEPQSPRARQNVILELGYFIGKLGRKHVCALHREGVELPSDYHGVLYVSLDKQDWKMKLAQEMKAAGLSVDLNTVVETKR